MNQDQTPKIIFVTGKGGVGKSVVSLALAQKESALKKVLLVELGVHSFFSDFLGVTVGYNPTKGPFDIDFTLWSGADCLKEYAIHLLKLKSLYQLFFENKISRALIEVAPALSELAILGKITSGQRRVGPELNYDLIVVDAYSTGHMLSLLRAPRGMSESIGFGPMAEQTRSILQVLRDPKVCKYVIVTLPEELPALEAEELHRELKIETGIDSEIYCNKIWPYHEIQALKKECETLSYSQSTASQSTAFNKDELQFARDLSDLTERQQSWVHYLEHRHRVVHKIPMVYSSDPQKIIKELGESLR